MKYAFLSIQLFAVVALLYSLFVETFQAGEQFALGYIGFLMACGLLTVFIPEEYLKPMDRPSLLYRVADVILDMITIVVLVVAQHPYIAVAYAIVWIMVRIKADNIRERSEEKQESRV